MNSIKKFFIASSLALVPASFGLPASVALAAVTANTVNSPVQNATDIQTSLVQCHRWFIWVVIIVSVIMVVFAAFELCHRGR